MSKQRAKGTAGEPLRMKPAEYCARFYAWLPLAQAAMPGLADHVAPVRLAIEKSCLLDRMINGGEMPSQTPCPVHQGKWSGIQSPWPGYVTHEIATGIQTPIPDSEVSEFCMAWYAAGCRCFQHKCGCTTGWQPDAACGCLGWRSGGGL